MTKAVGKNRASMKEAGGTPGKWMAASGPSKTRKAEVAQQLGCERSGDWGGGESQERYPGKGWGKDLVI